MGLMTAGDVISHRCAVQIVICLLTFEFAADVNGKILYSNVMFEAALHYPIGKLVADSMNALQHLLVSNMMKSNAMLQGP